MALGAPWRVAAVTRRRSLVEVALVLHFLALLVMVVMSSCAPSMICGRAAATRCGFRGGFSVRETCGADGRWRVTLDCGEVSRWSASPFACGDVDGGGATCLPVGR